MPTRVKICGITRLEDAEAAVRAGADALGFMFYEKSPRCVSIEAAATIIRSLPPFVAKVGVFVNPSAAQVESALHMCGLDTLQFHGEESPEFCRSFPGLKIIKAFRIQDPSSLQALPAYRNHADAWLLDSFVPGQHGGTGAAFNWDLAQTVVRMGHPILLAGGLNPGNVAEAIRTVHPFAVDVSSGVESAPGLKDPAKIAAFLQATRSVGK